MTDLPFFIPNVGSCRYSNSHVPSLMKQSPLALVPYKAALIAEPYTFHTALFSDYDRKWLTGMAGSDTQYGVHVRHLSLIALVFQNSAVTLIMRYTVAGVDKAELYLPSVVVLMSETLKAITCTYMLSLYSPERSLLGIRKLIYQELFTKRLEMMKLSIPALLYLIQNNLQFIASSNLDPAVFQVTYQLKILTTAVFSVLLLRMSLSYMKWVSLVLLTAGIACVQISSTSEPGDYTRPENSVKGLAAVITACILSGMAGVYFEKLLKNPSGSKSTIDDLEEGKVKAHSKIMVPDEAQLWIRSLQLSIWSAFLAFFLTIVWKDGQQVYQHGLFWNFTPAVWFLVAVHALGGIIVGIVVKYADNILKGFATSLSIILSTALSVWFLGFSITWMFIIGTTLVLFATYLYTL